MPPAGGISLAQDSASRSRDTRGPGDPEPATRLSSRSSSLMYGLTCSDASATRSCAAAQSWMMNCSRSPSCRTRRCVYASDAKAISSAKAIRPSFRFTETRYALMLGPWFVRASLNQRSFTDDGLLALWSRRNHPHRHAGPFRDVGQIITRGLWQVFHILNGGDVFLPSRQRFVNRLDALERLGFARESRRRLAVIAIRRAHLDLIEAAQHIELGHGVVGDAVDHRRVAEGHEVEPAAAARPAGGGAELMPYLLQTPSVFVFELGREGTVADAGTVGFDDADHTLDCGRWNTEARAAAAYSGMARRDERIRAEIDVEQ